MLSLLLALLIGFTANTPTTQPTFSEQRQVSNAKWGTVFTDVACHLPKMARYDSAYYRYLKRGDLITASHEWTHFLNEHLSSSNGSGYYLLNGRYAVLTTPRKLRGNVPYVPPSLRGELFDLYLIQNRGNAQVDPLYLLDEWTAYINDVTTAVDQLKNGKPLDTSGDATQPHTAGNVLEFTFYGFAVGMAVEKYDPQYYNGPEGKKLRDFILLNAQRSLIIHAEALGYPEISKGDRRNTELWENFRGKKDTSAMRTWVKMEFPELKIW